ncbi:MAG TPA: hypothetical protein DIU07_15095 [Rhodobacteraceae bacterium]|nr:hypothetical protein [Paracoccaceae bacterium]
MTIDERLATAFNTLAHPRRARLFRLLVSNPEAGRSFTALMSATGYRKTPLSHHLEIMERGGLIRRQRIGNAMTFMLTPGPLSAAMTDAQRQASRATGPARRIA